MTNSPRLTDRHGRIALGVLGALFLGASFAPELLGRGNVGFGPTQICLLISGVTLIVGSILMARVRATEPARILLSILVVAPIVVLGSLVNVAFFVGGLPAATAAAVVICGGSVALALGMLSLRRPTVDLLVTRIPLLFATVLITLVIADLSVRSLGLDPDVSAPVWAREVGSPYRRSEIPGSPHELVPNYRWGHRYSTDEREYFGALGGVDYQTNSAGYRDSEFSPANASDYRIALLGDSFAFGLGVRIEDTVATLLEPALSDASGCAVEVLNFSVPAYRTADEVVLLRSTVMGYEPDMVVVWFFLNDANVIPTMHYLGEDRRRLFALVRPYSALARFLGSRLDATLGSIALTRDYRRGYEKTGLDWQNLGDDFEGIIKTANSMEVPVVFFVHPVLFRLDADYPFADIHEQVIQALRERGATAFDLVPAFAGYSGRELWVHPADLHPNEIGHRLAATFAAQKLAPMIPSCSTGPR
jgi:hypothetical protein